MADYARAERLRELRSATHRSQEDVAHEIGVSTKTLRTWEAGGKIRWPNAQRLAAFYGVDAEGLVSREIAESVPVPNDGQVVTLEQISDKLDEVLSRLRALEAGAQLGEFERRGTRRSATARDAPAGTAKRSRKTS